LGIAKVFGHFDQANQSETSSFSDAKSMRDIGVLLLQQVGVNEPSDEDISRAIAAHNALLDALSGIAERHQVVMLEP
jgi:hypothetical protein